MDILENGNKTCYNCGKTFHTPTDLQRHKNRKTPCLIRDLKPEDIKNPNRCIYCNTIFSTPGNLKKHHTKCKVKNGGMQTLHDKVKYEETIRIIREENNQNTNKIMDVLLNVRLELNAIREENKELRAQIPLNNTGIAGDHNTNIAGNNNNVKTTNNTININNYNTPSTEYIKNLDKFAEIFKREMAGTPMALVEKIWFDPEHPENSAIHLVNKKNGEILVVIDGRWITENAANIIPVVRHLVYELTQGMIANNYARLINFSNDMVPKYLELNRKDEGAIKRDTEEIMQKMIDGRKISQLAVDRYK